WKDVYSERLTVERNWRRGRCSVRCLHGHTHAVRALQFDEAKLITIRVWNWGSGECIRTLEGHTDSVVSQL
ncbi:hypothetical protein M405DRAFT_741696, partial [Rhizopogon salebrosus TDB-379]